LELHLFLQSHYCRRKEKPSGSHLVLGADRPAEDAAERKPVENDQAEKTASSPCHQGPPVGQFSLWRTSEPPTDLGFTA